MQIIQGICPRPSLSSSFSLIEPLQNGKSGLPLCYIEGDGDTGDAPVRGETADRLERLPLL